MPGFGRSYGKKPTKKMSKKKPVGAKRAKGKKGVKAKKGRYGG